MSGDSLSPHEKIALESSSLKSITADLEQLRGEYLTLEDFERIRDSILEKIQLHNASFGLAESGVPNPTWSLLGGVNLFADSEPQILSLTQFTSTKKLALLHHNGKDTVLLS